MAGTGAIHGVDDTLKQIAKAAVAGLATAPQVTVGPLESTGGDARVNWFLYRVTAHPAFRNMEPPRTGWRTSRGRPPLALQLHYLLTAFPSSQGPGGDHEQFAHSAIAAVMRALHENAVLGNDDPALSPLAKPLVEPVRITLASLDLDTLTKIWTAATEPMRLSVGYEVSLVTVDSTTTHVAGPPVRTRRVAVAPTIGPRLLAANPERAAAAMEIVVDLEGATAATAFSLAREDGDPPGPADWPLDVVRFEGAGRVVLSLARADLAAGERRLDARAVEGGLAVGEDSIGLTVVPRVTAPATTASPGAKVTLTTAHATPDVEVFLRGGRVANAGVKYVSATSVELDLPPDAAPGPAPLSLRANRVAGPEFDGMVIGP